MFTNDAVADHYIRSDGGHAVDDDVEQRRAGRHDGRVGRHLLAVNGGGPIGGELPCAVKLDVSHACSPSHVSPAFGEI